MEIQSGRIKTLKRVLDRINDKEFRQYIALYNNPARPQVIINENNKEKGRVVYLIKEEGKGYGFFAEIEALLAKLIYADYLGFVPYVWYGEQFALYDNISWCKNAFEYYFEQISDVKNIGEERSVVSATFLHGKMIRTNLDGNSYEKSQMYEEEIIKVWKKYLKIKPEHIDKFNKDMCELLDEQKVLSVHYRGTDYKMHYNKHPKDVEMNQLINEIDFALDRINYPCIFLATDDNSCISLLQKRYGKRVKFYKSTYRADNSTTSLIFSDNSRNNHKYKLGVEVLRDMYTMSMTDGLICGLSNVPTAAKWYKKSLDETYSYYKQINNGICYNNNSFRRPK